MFRRIACGSLLCGVLALAAGCADKIPPIPTPTVVNETFTGTVHPASGETHTLITPAGGARTARPPAVGHGSTTNGGFSLGTFSPVLNTCSAVFDNPAALQSFELKATASTIGNYCVRVYDNGNVTTDGVPYTYTVQVSHP